MRLICLGAIVLGAVACDEGGSTAAPTSVSSDLATTPSSDLSAAVTGDMATGTTFPATATVLVGPGNTLTYAPATVDIRAGGTVTWNWAAGITMPHTVTSGDNPPAFAGSAVQMSGSFSNTFASAGTFGYFCTVHGRIMNGTVVVH